MRQWQKDVQPAKTPKIMVIAQNCKANQMFDSKILL